MRGCTSMGVLCVVCCVLCSDLLCGTLYSVFKLWCCTVYCLCCTARTIESSIDTTLIVQVEHAYLQNAGHTCK